MLNKPGFNAEFMNKIKKGVKDMPGFGDKMGFDRDIYVTNQAKEMKQDASMAGVDDMTVQVLLFSIASSLKSLQFTINKIHKHITKK
jgi:hypothetical protein